MNSKQKSPYCLTVSAHRFPRNFPLLQKCGDTFLWTVQIHKTDPLSGEVSYRESNHLVNVMFNMSPYLIGRMSYHRALWIITQKDELVRTYYTKDGDLACISYFDSNHAPRAAEMIDKLYGCMVIENINGGFPVIIHAPIPEPDCMLCVTKYRDENGQEKVKYELHGGHMATFGCGVSIQVANTSTIIFTERGKLPLTFKIRGFNFRVSKRIYMFDHLNYTLTWNGVDDCSDENRAFSICFREPEIRKLACIEGISSHLKRIILTLV